MSKKDLKLAEIKKHNPTLFSKVKSGDITVQEAYNITMPEIMNVKEMKGKSEKGFKPLFSKDVNDPSERSHD